MLWGKGRHRIAHTGVVLHPYQRTAQRKPSLFDDFPHLRFRTPVNEQKNMSVVRKFGYKRFKHVANLSHSITRTIIGDSLMSPFLASVQFIITLKVNTVRRVGQQQCYGTVWKVTD